MQKKVVILGSTGSIGRNAIEIILNSLNEYKIIALSAFSNIQELNKQIAELEPRFVTVANTDFIDEVHSDILNGGKLYSGSEGICRMIEDSDADIIINSIVGAAGLLPTLMAIRSGKNVALANKESLVVAGELVIEEARKYGVNIIPIDSEHSAIWQCLIGEDKEKINKIILTASGGPFLRRETETFNTITVDEALHHPNWEMGSKITIDSATLMNKGFEIIETKWLFDIPPEKISVVIHPQSIVHSMVEFIDGSIKAQLGMPDMKLPIQYALTYPDRKPGLVENDNLFNSMELSFEQPDLNQFPGLKLAYRALEAGGTAPAVLNAANEVAVRLFLQEKIPFSTIPCLIDSVLQEHNVISSPKLEDYLASDSWARILTEKKAKLYGT